jgi:hypothetical protein
MKSIYALAVLLAVAGCDDTAAKRRDFMAQCFAAQFTPAQCLFLLAMTEESGSISANEQIMMGLAAGVTAPAVVWPGSKR